MPRGDGTAPRAERRTVRFALLLGGRRLASAAGASAIAGGRPVPDVIDDLVGATEVVLARLRRRVPEVGGLLDRATAAAPKVLSTFVRRAPALATWLDLRGH